MKNIVKIIAVFSVIGNIILLWFCCTLNTPKIAQLEPRKSLLRTKKVDTKSHYCETDDLFNALKIDSADLVFIGDSFIDNFKIVEMLDTIPSKNRGIPGEFSAGVVDQLKQIESNQASKYFIYIGVNDVLFNIKKRETLRNYRKIFQLLRQKSPLAKIYVLSILPFRNNSNLCKDCNPEIENLNTGIQSLCESNNVTFISISKDFKLKNSNQIQSKYVISDGVHLNAAGYTLLKNKLDPYIFAE